MKKKHPRRSGKNVSDGRKVKKTNGQSKRRMGNQIARLIDEGLFYFLALRHDYFCTGEGIGLVATEDEDLTITEDLL